jgi:hypothetical protein
MVPPVSAYHVNYPHGDYRLSSGRARRQIAVECMENGNGKPQDCVGKDLRKRSHLFLPIQSNGIRVVMMGVFDRAREMSGLSTRADNARPYVCLACETAFEVQHHNCPVCGSFDIRRSRWVQE